MPEGGKMQRYYRLESSQGGYLGIAESLKTARKRAIGLATQYGYPVKVFKAERNALRETRGTVVFSARPSGVRNPGGRKLTKLQRKVQAAKKASDRRIAVALAKYLKQENPGRKIVGAKVVKGKGGRRSITPIFGKRGKR